MSVIPRDDRAHRSEYRRWRCALPSLPQAACLAAAAAAVTLLAACGGSSAPAGASGNAAPAGGSTTAQGGSSSSSSPSSSSGGKATGGSMGCLTGTWRSNTISERQLSMKGGDGVILTVQGDGAFSINASQMKPMTFTVNGATGSMRFTGQETGQFVVSGTKLAGTKYDPGSFATESVVNGVKINVPVNRFSDGKKALSWEAFSCAGNTLTMVNPPPGSNWTFSRVG